jgi:hypothetical protein
MYHVRGWALGTVDGHDRTADGHRGPHTTVTNPFDGAEVGTVSDMLPEDTQTLPRTGQRWRMNRQATFALCGRVP